MYFQSYVYRNFIRYAWKRHSLTHSCLNLVFCFFYPTQVWLSPTSRIFRRRVSWRRGRRSGGKKRKRNPPSLSLSVWWHLLPSALETAWSTFSLSPFEFLLVPLLPSRPPSASTSLLLLSLHAPFLLWPMRDAWGSASKECDSLSFLLLEFVAGLYCVFALSYLLSRGCLLPGWEVKRSAPNSRVVTEKSRFVFRKLASLSRILLRLCDSTRVLPYAAVGFLELSLVSSCFAHWSLSVLTLLINWLERMNASLWMSEWIVTLPISECYFCEFSGATSPLGRQWDVNFVTHYQSYLGVRFG